MEINLLSPTILLAGIVAILTVVYLWLQFHYSYWKRHNVPYIEPNFIFGNFKDLITWKQGPCEYFQNLYKHKNAVNQPVVGLHVFGKPCLLLRDLEVIKSVTIRDFNKFANRFTSSDPHHDPLGADNLFFVKNPRWKEIRVKLTPVFTSGKMKQMFPLIEEIGRELDRHLTNLTNSGLTIQEVKSIAALYTTDVIASAAYGIQANSMKNPDGEFRRNGKTLFEFTRFRSLELAATFFLPSIVKLCRFKVFNSATTKFIRDTVSYAMKERIKSGTTRNDLIDILIAFRKQAEMEKGESHFILQGDCLIAQAAIFFSAGFETSSGTMSFALYELARRQDLQQRLREEIRESLKKCGGVLTYDIIGEMKFLDNIIQEVLRFYPPLAFLDRQCTVSKGERYSLKPHSNFSIPNGMPVYIPIQALHMDPQYFTNPEDFNPDRFNPENKHMVNLGAYMPFGVGPHNCIGERFGVLQVKVGLINFLKNHYVTPCEKSHPNMKLDRRALIIQSEGGIFCKLIRDPLV